VQKPEKPQHVILSRRNCEAAKDDEGFQNARLVAFDDSSLALRMTERTGFELQLSIANANSQERTDMIDLDGLQVAYLGVALAHYLDLESGEILDLPLDAAPPGDASRFRRIPTRTEESEAEDRRLFVEGLEFSVVREHLARVIDQPTEFRRAIAEDRRVERAFFNFKNDQATRAIEEWLEREGIGN
jgi:hypothetical protein